MAAPDIEGLIQRRLAELMDLVNRKLPVKVGSKVRAYIRQNFRKGRFYNGQSWQTPLRTNLGLEGPGYGLICHDGNNCYNCRYHCYCYP